MIDSLRARAWRAYADTRRVLARGGTAAAAAPAVAGADRADHAAWTSHLAAQHERYRSSVAPLPDQVAIVCVSSRPHLLGDVATSVRHQTHGARELVMVTNSEGYDQIDVDAALDPIALGCSNVTVLRRPADRSLGACLNDALDSTDARFVAKFDDDDLYGAHYLSDAMRAHSYAGAAVVGKHTYYAYLRVDNKTVLRFPAHEFTYSSTLAGGTLVIDRERTGDLRFEDVSLGEDRSLIAACHRRGLSTFSADRFNFVQIRAADNTWTVSNDHFLLGTLPVQEGLPLDRVDL